MRPIRTFDNDDFIGICHAQGWTYKRHGAEFEVDVEQSGHLEYKVHPRKGVYLTSGGDSGTIAQLLYDKKAGNDRNVPVVPKPCSRSTREQKKLTAASFLADSLPRIIQPGMLCTLEHQAGWTAVKRYLKSRGLDLDAIPPATRIKSGRDGGFDLIIPLENGQPEAENRPVHVTMIMTSGQKRPQKWLDGNCRITVGPQKRPEGGKAYAIIPARAGNMRIPGHDGPAFCTGEGLESAGTGNLLSGYAAIFAVNKAGLASTLENPEIVKVVKAENRLMMLMVDRDTSGDGQKAAALLALKAQKLNIPFRFCVPPEAVKGGKKGADWNDALMELGVDVARGALVAAMEQSQAELDIVLKAHPDILDKTQQQPLIHFQRVRPAQDTPPSPPVNRRSLSEIEALTRGKIQGYLLNGLGDGQRKKSPLMLLGSDCGTGKSFIAANEVGKLNDRLATLTVVPTRALADEAATHANGTVAPARNKKSCLIFPEVEPFGEKWRSIAVHLCQSCDHGLRAMDEVRPLKDGPRCEDTMIEPCPYIMETYESREADGLYVTGAKVESGDSQLFVKNLDKGKKEKRKLIFDDVTVLDQFRTISAVEIGEWIRTAKFVGQKLMSRAIAHKNEKREVTAKCTLLLIPELQRLHDVVATHTDTAQAALAAGDWTDFCSMVNNTDIDLLDGTTPEMVRQDDEGKIRIPLRALRDVAEAISRNTAWVQSEKLHIATRTELSKCLASGAMVMDATPSYGLRKVVAAHGGNYTEGRANQNGLKIVQVVDGTHGKAACNPDLPSFPREKQRLLSTIRDALKIVDGPSLYILSYRDFVSAILDEIAPMRNDPWLSKPERPEMTVLGIPTANFGWFGCHDRGQNDWKEGKYCIIWGVPQLSPTTNERGYTAMRRSVMEAGGDAPAEWDGTRTRRWYRIPGTDHEMEANGYENPDIDDWSREYVTARIVQATSRLRAVRRQDQSIIVEIHSTFAFGDDHGFRVDTVREAAWRTAQDYHAERKASQLTRAVIGLAAVQSKAAHERGRRSVNAALAAMSLPGIDNNTWADIERQASGLLREYSLFQCQTTPSALEKAYADVAAALPDVWSLDFSDIVVLQDPDLRDKAGFSLAEQVASLILDADTSIAVAGAPLVCS